MARIRKNANGAPAPIPSPTPDLAPVPTAEELRRRIVEIKQRLIELDSERKSLCMSAWRGDQGAKNRIGAIDDERRALHSEKKTAQTILNQFQSAQQDPRKHRDFERNRRTWVRWLQVQTIERWGNAGAHLAKLINEGRLEEANAHWRGEPMPGQKRDRHTPVSPIDIPATIARELVDPICTFQKVTLTPGLYQEALDTALRDELVEQLLAETKLPALPETLKDFIAFAERLEPATPPPRMPSNERQPDNSEVKAKLMDSKLPARKVVSAPPPHEIMQSNRLPGGRFPRV